MTRVLPLLMLLPLACSSSNDVSLIIDVPFALFASDELQFFSMLPCSFTPITRPGVPSRASGLLELDPAVNPSPSYVLGVQVVNFLSSPTENDFLVSAAVVHYIPQQLFLEPNMPATVTFPVSATVKAGGKAAATAVLIQTMTSEVVSVLSQNLVAGSVTEGDVVLQVQLEGALRNGESMVSELFGFPLHVCIDCGANPLSCVNGFTASPSGHGPCCAPQDFFDVCVPCGGVGEPCCAPPDTVPATCSRDADCQGAYGASSICDDDAGACTPGCNADPTGKPMTCKLATSLPEGTELCSYLNSGGLTSVCGSP